MRSTLLSKLVLAAIATGANAHKSKYYTDWDWMMEEINCPNGPVECGDDGQCGEGYACLNTSFGASVCDDISKWTCYMKCEDQGRV